MNATQTFKQSVVCTLFEGHYHYGVAALINSLYHLGFKGDIYAGYRGELPNWLNFPESPIMYDWVGGRAFTVIDGIRLHLLPIDTDYHFANYKPNFIISLWEGPANKANSIVYFDPDIVLSTKWALFEEWIGCGIALCEDMNSPLPENHPRRVVWRKFFSEKGIILSFKSTVYANSGFIGIERKSLPFLLIWQKALEYIGPQIQGLNRSSLPGGATLLKGLVGTFNAFDIPDQDALNVAIEAWKDNISFVGQEAMAFKHGSNLMMHATGQPKPWNKNFTFNALNGKPASLAEKSYLSNTQYPINIYSKTKNLINRIDIKVAALISRFYRQTN